MNKTISMIIEETKQTLIQVVNESGLPLCVVETIVKDFYSEVVASSNQQAEKERQAYEMELSKTEENESLIKSEKTTKEE